MANVERNYGFCKMTDLFLRRIRVGKRRLSTRRDSRRRGTVSAGPAITSSSRYRRRTAGYPHHRCYRRITQPSSSATGGLRRKIKVSHPNLFNFLTHLQNVTVDKTADLQRRKRGSEIRRPKTKEKSSE